MKRTISLLVAALFVLTLFVSCGKGASVSIYKVRTANEIKNIFIQNTASEIGVRLVGSVDVYKRQASASLISKSMNSP